MGPEVDWPSLTQYGTVQPEGVELRERPGPRGKRSILPKSIFFSLVFSVWKDVEREDDRF